MPNEPSLSELSNVAVDADLATGGSPRVVENNQQMLNILNQNAQFVAQNDWNKYKTFLGDLENKYKSIQDQADKQVAEADRPYLKKQATDLLKGALKDPYAIYSPEFNSKLSSLTADATSSKMANDYAQEHQKFITLNPTWNTEDNNNKVKDYLENQTLEKGGRKTFALDAPDLVDNMALFGGLKKAATKSAVTDNLLPDGTFNKVTTETTKYDDYLNQAKLSLTTPSVKKHAQSLYNSLPEEVKSQYKDVDEFWADLATKHFGSDQDIVSVTANDLTRDPAYMMKENLDFNKVKEANDNYNAQLNRDLQWKIANLKSDTSLDVAAIKAAEKKLKTDKKIAENIYTPLPQIVNSLGGYNKQAKLSDLTAPQIMAIDNDFYDFDNKKIPSKYKDYKVAVGINNQGQEIVYIYDKEGKRIDGKNATDLLTNGAAARAVTKEKGKITDIYATNLDDYKALASEAFSARGESQVAPTTQTTTEETVTVSKNGTNYPILKKDLAKAIAAGFKTVK